MMRGRNQERAPFELPVRVALLEGDVDSVDDRHIQFVLDVRSSQDKLAESIDSVKRVLVGILVSVTTASIFLAINLIAGK